MSDALPVMDNTGAQRFEIHADGAIAYLTYRMRGDAIEYLHSETPPELRGRGLAGQIAKFALDRDKAANRRVIPSCPFVETYIRRHAEYAPLVRAEAG